MRHRSNSRKRTRKSTKRAKKHVRRPTVRRRPRSSRIKATKRITPRTLEQFFAVPKEFQEKWTRMTHVITTMRDEGTSLREAARRFGLNPRSVIRLGRSALRKCKSGRYMTRPTDRLLRILVIPTKQGLKEIALRNSRLASLIGEYWNAVQKYLSSGDSSALLQFQGKRITDASGKRWKLLTDLDVLDVLGSAGVVSFESIYAKVR